MQETPRDPEDSGQPHRDSAEICAACGYPFAPSGTDRPCAECGSKQRTTLAAIAAHRSIRLGSFAVASTATLLHFLLLLIWAGTSSTGFILWMVLPTGAPLLASLASAVARRHLPLEWWEAAMFGFTIAAGMTGSAVLALWTVFPPAGPGASTSGLVVVMSPCAASLFGVVGAGAAAIAQIARRERAQTPCVRTDRHFAP